MLHLRYRKDIDGLRGLSILAVLGFHLFPRIFPGGFIGVDIFFVISGYLITLLILKNISQKEFSFVAFYLRRIKRLVPSLLVVLFTCFGVGWFLLGEIEFSLLGKHIAGAAVFSTNLLLWHESGYFDQDSIRKPLLHLWSLGVEEQFYIVWPPLVWIIARYCSKFLGIFTGLVIITSFIYGLWALYLGLPAAYYSPFSRIWEFVFGSILSFYFANGKAYESIQQYFSRYKNSISLVSLNLIIFSIFFIREDFLFPGWWALLPILGAIGLILTRGSIISSAFLSTRIMVWIGLISYPLYLVHWPIISFFELVTLNKPTLIESCQIFLVSIFLSWLIYIFVERPMRLRGNHIAIFSLVCLLIASGGIGYNTYIRNGLAFRPIVKKQVSVNIEKYLSPPSDWVNCDVTDSNIPDKACLESAGSKVFLWGDSHAANVAYGLGTTANLKKFNIKLYVTMKGGCPPILNYQPYKASALQASCDSFTQQTIQKVAQYRPEVVILSAKWLLYYFGKDVNKISDLDFLNTIQILKNLGVKKIVVIGLFPSYDVYLPNIASRVFVQNKVDRTRDWLKSNVYEINAHISNLANVSGVNFISPLDILCNYDGCLISASQSTLVPTAYDASHMTYPGSQYFIEHGISSDYFR